MTQKAFREKHQAFMNEEFIKRNPEGQFAIQRRGAYVNIYVNFKRRTSWSAGVYPDAFGIEKSNCGGYFYFIKYQNNSFEKVTHYNSLDNFLKACERYGVKGAAIETFLFYYNKRSDVEFVAEVRKQLKNTWTFKKGMEMAIISGSPLKKKKSRKPTEKEVYQKLCE